MRDRSRRSEPWTDREVRAALVEAMRMGATLNWHRRFLAEDGPGWAKLKAWAECRASGEPIEERRRLRGWTRWQFQAGLCRASAAIAAGLNDEPLNPAGGQAAEAAAGRLARGGRLLRGARS